MILFGSTTRVGIAQDGGLFPISGSLPPNGAMPAVAFVTANPIMFCRTARLAQNPEWP